MLKKILNKIILTHYIKYKISGNMKKQKLKNQKQESEQKQQIQDKKRGTYL